MSSHFAHLRDLRKYGNYLKILSLYPRTWSLNQSADWFSCLAHYYAKYRVNCFHDFASAFPRNRSKFHLDVDIAQNLRTSIARMRWASEWADERGGRRIRERLQERKKVSQSVNQTLYALTLARNNPRVTSRAPCNASLLAYVRARCNVNWNYTCVVTRENAWSWERSRPGRMMYASCRAIRTEVVDKDGPTSHSRDHLRPGYTTLRAILLRTNVRACDCESDSFSVIPRLNSKVQHGIWIFPRTYAWLFKEILSTVLIYSPHLTVNIAIRDSKSRKIV